MAAAASPRPFQHIDLRAAMSSSPILLLPHVTAGSSDLHSEATADITDTPILKKRQARKKASDSNKPPTARRKSKEQQEKLPKARITKVIREPGSGSATQKVTEVITLPEQALSSERDADIITLPETIPSNLAIARRLDWTPPKALNANTFAMVIDLEDQDATASGAFAALTGKFQYSGSTSSTAAKGDTTDPGFIANRKKVDLVSSKPHKEAAKTRRKRASTKTTKAVAPAPFVPEPPPIQQYFAKKTNAGLETTDFAPNPRSRSRSKASTSTKGDGSSAQPILLSPSSALKQTKQQSFVFGTSSQLAQGDSPRTLRQLHLAMTLSNKAEEDPFYTPSVEYRVDGPFNGKRFFGTNSKSSLWSAGARDSRGDLLEVESIDMTKSPDEEAAQSLIEMSPTRGKSKTIIRVASPAPLAIESTDADSASPRNVTSRRITPLNSPKPVPVPQEEPPVVSDPDPLPLEKFTNSPPAHKAPSIPKPNFDSWTDQRLLKELASYHFKPVRGRKNMISLLEKCWDSKQRTALKAKDTNRASGTLYIPAPKAVHKRASGEDAPITAPKRPRGRPPASGSRSKATTAKVEIPSSDAEGSDVPLAQVRSARAVPKLVDPELSIPESIEDSEASEDLSPTVSQEIIFSCITKAITSAPRSNNPQQPSWYEKMLMYDPIVLEDLTAWLNTGALDKAGWDGEVWPGLVKEWCETKSICCFWKQTYQGMTRKVM